MHATRRSRESKRSAYIKPAYALETRRKLDKGDSDAKGIIFAISNNSNVPNYENRRKISFWRSSRWLQLWKRLFVVMEVRFHKGDCKSQCHACMYVYIKHYILTAQDLCSLNSTYLSFSVLCKVNTARWYRWDCKCVQLHDCYSAILEWKRTRTHNVHY